MWILSWLTQKIYGDIRVPSSQFEELVIQLEDLRVRFHEDHVDAEAYILTLQPPEIISRQEYEMVSEPLRQLVQQAELTAPEVAREYEQIIEMIDERVRADPVLGQEYQEVRVLMAGVIHDLREQLEDKRRLRRALDSVEALYRDVRVEIVFGDGV